MSKKIDIFFILTIMLGMFAGFPSIVFAIDDFPGNALEFDGIDDYVNIGNDASLNVGENFTIEVWIKPFDLSGRFSIFSTRNLNDAGSFQLEVGTGSGGVNRVAVTGVNTWIAETESDAITLNEWNHIAYNRWDIAGGVQQLFVNGKEQTLVSSSDYTFIDNTSNKVIASGTNGGQHLAGLIEEVRFWNVRRSVLDIRENMYLMLSGSETGLVSYWQMNDGTGTVTTDEISGNHGILYNMTEDDWIESFIPFGSGNSDTQYSDDGYVDFLFIGLSIYYHISDDASLTATRIDGTPNINPDMETIFDSQYWIIDRDGDGEFLADFIFDLYEDLTPEDELHPEWFKLYKRPSNSEDEWQYVTEASEINAPGDEVTFEGITEFSQFIITGGYFIPDIHLETDSLNFGIIEIGDSQTDTLTVYNVGDDTLFVSDISCDNPDYSVNLESCEILQGDSLDILVTFAPTSHDIISGNLTIISDDPDESAVNVILHGEGFTQKYIELLEMPISFTLTSSDFNSIDIGDYPNPTFYDIDNDGLLDLIIGESNQNLNHYEQESENSSSFSYVRGLKSNGTKSYYNDKFSFTKSTQTPFSARD